MARASQPSRLRSCLLALAAPRRVEAGPQVLAGPGRGVERLVSGALGIGAEVAEGAEDLEPDGDDHGDRHGDHRDGGGGEQGGVRHAAQRSVGCR